MLRGRRRGQCRTVTRGLRLASLRLHVWQIVAHERRVLWQGHAIRRVADLILLVAEADFARQRGALGPICWRAGFLGQVRHLHARVADVGAIGTGEVRHAVRQSNYSVLVLMIYVYDRAGALRVADEVVWVFRRQAVECRVVPFLLLLQRFDLEPGLIPLVINTGEYKHVQYQ